MFILAHHTDWYRFNFWVLPLTFSVVCFSKVTNRFLFDFCFQKYSALQFNCFVLFYVNQDPLKPPSSWPKSLACFVLRVNAIVELIESYGIFCCPTIKNHLFSNFIKKCVLIHASVKVLLRVPTFTNNHKIKTFFAWRKINIYNKQGREWGNILSFDKSTDAQIV